MCSKIFGKGTLDSLAGDIIGGGLGFLAGGPVGAAVGAGLGGGIGESLGGGSLTQDLSAGALGSALAGGVSELGVGLAQGGLDAGTAGAGAAAAGVGDLAAGSEAPLAASDAAIAGGAGATDAGVAAAAAPGIAADASSAALPVAIGPAEAGAAPGIVAAPPAAIDAFADTTSLAASQGGELFTGAVDAAPVTAQAAASPLDQVLAEGAAGTLPGQTETAGQVASELAASGEAVPVPPTPPLGGAIGAGISDFGSSVGNYITAHPLQAAGTALSGLGLVRSLATAQNPNPIPGMAQLSQLATELGTTGASLVNANSAKAGGVATQAQQQAGVLENYLNSGTLPPAVQAALDQATKDGITDIVAQHAARGDVGSTSQQMEIEALKQRAVIQGGTIAAQLYSQGVSLDQLAANIFSNLTGTGGQLASGAAGAQESLINTGVALNTGVNNAIANLSSALGGGSRAIVNGNTVTLPAAA